jgi:hypothetical protein
MKQKKIIKTIILFSVILGLCFSFLIYLLLNPQIESPIKCGDKCELNNADCSGDTCKPINESLPMFNCDSQSLTTEKCEELGVVIQQ